MTESERKTKRDWSDPHLLAGRGLVVTLAVSAMIGVGSFTDTIAFKSTLDLLLRAPSWQSWGMAVGATLLALVGAMNLGVALAGRRRHDADSPLWMALASASVWVSLGAVLFYVRWTSAASTSDALGFSAVASDQSQHNHQAHAGALFFGALFLISGIAAALEAGRLANPAFRAFRRSSAACESQEAVVARAAAEAERAKCAVEHQNGEHERDELRRDHARSERIALAGEAANYARVLMAQLMQDPRKTGVTAFGPHSGPTDDPGDPGPTLRLTA